MSAARAERNPRAGRAAIAAPAESARDFETIALVLQGGGALGAYQCGVYEALADAGILPSWFAGTSIGAINAAILAGNAPAHRVERLREFWNLVCSGAGPFAWPAEAMRESLRWAPPSDTLNAWAGVASAVGALTQGQRGFFVPRALPPIGQRRGSPAATSFYDTAPLRATLERLVDFDRINADDTVRLTVGATNVATGNFRYFDSALETIRPEHVMASGALPPAFPAIVIDGEHYWDGGVVSNTPLEYLLESQPRRDSLVFQVDLWSARGMLPQTLPDVLERQKDIQYSSRTRLSTDAVAARQRLRNALSMLIERVPREDLPDDLESSLAPWLCDRVFDIVHLIYRAKPYEEQFKDYAFGLGAMRAHWESGLEDMRRSLAHPEFFVRPPRELGVVTHDVHRLDART